MTIKGRLIVTIGFLAVLLIAIGGIGLYGMGATKEGLRTVYEDRTIALDQVTRIARLILPDSLRVTQ